MAPVAKGVIIGILASLLGSVLLTACGGGSNDAAAGRSIVEAQTAALNTADTLMFVFENGFEELLVSSEVVIGCPSQGTATLTGNVEVVATGPTSGILAFDATVTFAQCDDLEGTLDLSGTGTFDSQQLTLSTTFDGSVTNGCRIEFAQLTESLVADAVTGDILAGSLDGALVANCAGIVARCLWQQVDAFDPDAMAAGCR